MDGAIAVKFVAPDVYQRRFYFCATKSCIRKPPPPWTNIKVPKKFTSAAEVADEERNAIMEDCGLESA